MLIVFFSFSEIPVLLTLLVPPALNDVPLVTNIWLLFRRNLTFSSCPHPKSALHNIRIDAAFVDLSQLTSTSRHVASPRAGLTLIKYRAGRPGQTQQLSCPNGRRHIYLLSCVELLGGRSQLMTGRLATHLCNNGGTGCLYPSVNCNPLNSTTSICCGFVCGRPTTCFCSCA